MSDRRRIRIDIPGVALAALIVLVLLCPAAAVSDAGSRGRPRMADSLWTEDLDYFARELPECHKNLFFKISREEFSSMVSHLVDRVPDLSDYEIAVSLMGILAEIGDAHTMLGVGFSGVFRRFAAKPILASAGGWSL